MESCEFEKFRSIKKAVIIDRTRSEVRTSPSWWRMPSRSGVAFAIVRQAKVIRKGLGIENEGFSSSVHWMGFDLNTEEIHGSERVRVRERIGVESPLFVS